MSPRQSKLIAAGALILGGFLSFRAMQPSPASPDSAAAGSHSALPGKSGGDGLDPAHSVSRLRSLREIRASDAPDFETVESWTRSISKKVLLELIEENWSDPYEGLTGWLRCALFAEWGRRDSGSMASPYSSKLTRHLGKSSLQSSMNWPSVTRSTRFASWRQKALSIWATQVHSVRSRTPGPPRRNYRPPQSARGDRTLQGTPLQGRLGNDP